MISYKPLWRLLVENGLKKEDLRLAIKTSPSTIAKMSKNQHISLDVIERICEYFECGVFDVIEYIPETILIKDWINEKNTAETFNAMDIHKGLVGHNIPLKVVESVLSKLCKEKQIEIIIPLHDQTLGILYKKRYQEV